MFLAIIGLFSTNITIAYDSSVSSNMDNAVIPSIDDSLLVEEDIALISTIGPSIVTEKDYGGITTGGSSGIMEPFIVFEDYNSDVSTNQDIIINASTCSNCILNTTSHTFTENGSFTFTTIDNYGNSVSETITISNIDKTAPTATVSYSTTSTTLGDVIATIIPSEPVTGDLTHTFTSNGEYTFNFTDLAGNTGSVLAQVNNIRRSSGGGGGRAGSMIKPVTATLITPSATSVVGKVLGETTFKFTKYLKFGSKGTEVTELQKRLSTEGLYTDTIDGIFGKNTKKAVIDFQTKNEINPLGVVGPLTRAVLNK